MKYMYIATACVATLGGCMSDTPTTIQATADKASFASVTSRSGFISNVAGRKIAEGDGYFVMNSDGTLEGVDVDGNAYSGIWTWENSTWCRAFNHTDGLTEPKCRSIAVNDAQIRITKIENGEAQFYRWQ